MTKPIFRNPDKFQVLPHREFIRKHLPSGTFGFVAEDLDLVIRVCGRNFNTDGGGKFMLMELKWYPHNIGMAQKRTFGLIDSLLKNGDKSRTRYKGFYVIQYDNEDWDLSRFWVNGIKVCREQLISFLRFELELKEMLFKYP